VGSAPGTAFGAGPEALMPLAVSSNHTVKGEPAGVLGSPMDICNNPGFTKPYCTKPNPKAFAMAAGCAWAYYRYNDPNAAANAKALCEQGSGGKPCTVVDTNGNTCPNMKQCNNPGATTTYCNLAGPKAWVMTPGCGHWQYYYRDPNAVEDALAACKKSTGQTCDVVDTDGDTCPPPPPTTTPVPTPAPSTTPAPGTCGIFPTNPVRNQGRCGSCWAFTTSEMMRYQYQTHYNGEDPGILSAQFLVDCAEKGCGGGNIANAIGFIIKHGGLPTTTAYGPYLDKGGTCNLNSAKALIPGPAYVTRNEDEMYKMLCSDGPFAVMINGDAPQHYAAGMMTPESCPAKPINHILIAIGTTRYKGVKVWVTQNSWGPWYGATQQGEASDGKNGGYILMKFGVNTCGFQTEATFLAGVFSVGGPHPWTHKKPLLEWTKRWGPYSGIYFKAGLNPIHKSSQGSWAECMAAAEGFGDSNAVYSADGKCSSTSGAWQVFSGSGPTSTLYQSGKPIGLPAHAEEEDQSALMPVVAVLTGSAMLASVVMFLVMRARQKQSSFSATEPLL